MVEMAFAAELTATGQVVETGILCERSPLIATSTMMTSPVRTHRTTRCEVRKADATGGRAVVSPARICSNNLALAWCSAVACSVSDNAFGLWAEPIGNRGIVPRNPASGPSLSGARSSLPESDSGMTASTGLIACTQEGNSTGASDSPSSAGRLSACCKETSLAPSSTGLESQSGIFIENRESTSSFVLGGDSLGDAKIFDSGKAVCA